MEKFTDVKKKSIDSASMEKEMLNLLENSILKSSEEEHLPSVIPDESSEDEPERKKKVRFNDWILNEKELDKSLLERITHNQRYNDDRIFENFSIF